MHLSELSSFRLEFEIMSKYPIAPIEPNVIHAAAFIVSHEMIYGISHNKSSAKKKEMEVLLQNGIETASD